MSQYKIICKRPSAKKWTVWKSQVEGDCPKHAIENEIRRDREGKSGPPYFRKDVRVIVINNRVNEVDEFILEEIPINPLQAVRIN